MSATESAATKGTFVPVSPDQTVIEHLRKALSTIATFPIPEQDNLPAANMRKIAEQALLSLPPVLSVASLRIIESNLIRMAAQILSGPNMPEPSSWPWTKRTSNRLYAASIRAENAAREQCRLWAISLKKSADDLQALMHRQPS